VLGRGGSGMNAPAAGEPLLEVRDVAKRFVLEHGLFARLSGRQRNLVALDGVSLSVAAGEVLGLVGESGSGKSTLGQAIVRLADVSAGTVRYRGQDVTQLAGATLKPFRRRVQMVFQDTHSSLNPRKTVRRTLEEALALRGLARTERPARAARLLGLVGLGGFALPRYPHELSGGQRQRVAIARALAMEPELLLADEPVSALDVSLQAQIINLLMRLREELGLTLLFISHDLALVNHIASRVAVMYAGRIVEIGRPEEVLRQPAHPYTRALIAAIPQGVEGRALKREPIPGNPPDPAALPPGCRFAGRCPQAMAVCAERYPAEVELAPGHRAACHLLTRKEAA